MHWLAVKFLFPVYKRIVSPIIHAAFGPAFGCRFIPTCSEFASEAIQRHGLIQGSWLSTKRICRCHPWSRSDYDPVPEISNRK